jgi:hypothetical protein
MVSREKAKLWSQQREGLTDPVSLRSSRNDELNEKPALFTRGGRERGNGAIIIRTRTAAVMHGNAAFLHDGVFQSDSYARKIYYRADRKCA